MENATKALLIAAGVMLSLMILSLLVLGYNEISSYYSDKQKVTQAKQISEFNSKYENYNRKNVRGNDLISLINRIIDYNDREVYADGTNYKRIEVTITIGTSNLDQFKYITESQKEKYLPFTYTSILPSNGKITNISNSDNQLVQLTTTINNVITANQSLGITDTNLQRLSSNISNIVLTNATENSTAESDVKDKQKRLTLLNNILKVPIAESNIKTIKQITCQYYEYTQFKRARFNCTEFKYDEQTGRVCEINFEVATQNGSVVFN